LQQRVVSTLSIQVALVCIAMCCSVLQCVAVCCSVLQCVAVCCSVLQTPLFLMCYLSASLCIFLIIEKTNAYHFSFQ